MRNEKEIPGSAQPADIWREIADVRSSVDMTRADIRRTKNDVEQCQIEHDSHVRRTRALWALAILLVGGLGTLTWFGVPTLKDHQGVLSNMPALQSTLDRVGVRVAATENKISEWANDRIGFSDRMSKVEQSVGSNLRTVRNEARSMAQQVKSEIGQNLQAIQNRISGVESIQREHGEETARLRAETGRLQSELDGVRKEFASFREESARQNLEVAQAQEAARSEVSGLNRRLNSNQSAVAALNYQVDRERFDFELQNGRTQRVIGDIYVTVKQTDVERQRVDGWVQLAGDGRIVWMRGEGAQKPIEFSNREETRPYRLVFTRIGRNSVAGYVLAPPTATASLAK